MNLPTFSTPIHGKETTKRFFPKHNGVIHQQWLCSNNPQMTLSAVSDWGRCYAWECRQEIGFRKRTWLERSRKVQDSNFIVTSAQFNSTTQQLLTGRNSFVKTAPGGFYRFQNYRRLSFGFQIFNTLISRRKTHTGPVQKRISEGSAGILKVPKHGPFHGKYWLHAPISSSFKFGRRVHFAPISTCKYAFERFFHFLWGT